MLRTCSWTSALQRIIARQHKTRCKSVYQWNQSKSYQCISWSYNMYVTHYTLRMTIDLYVWEMTSIFQLCSHGRSRAVAKHGWEVLYCILLSCIRDTFRAITHGRWLSRNSLRNLRTCLSRFQCQFWFWALDSPCSPILFHRFTMFQHQCSICDGMGNVLKGKFCEPQRGSEAPTHPSKILGSVASAALSYPWWIEPDLQSYYCKYVIKLSFNSS